MIFNFGSLNVDYVYSVDEFVKPGESLAIKSMKEFPGGKGLNQSVALSKAGGQVKHLGFVSSKSKFLTETLKSANVDASLIKEVDETNGHAIIQVNKDGQNSMLIYGGTNQMVSDEYVEKVSAEIEKGDYILFQNETNKTKELIIKAHEKGAVIALNASPMNEVCKNLPLDLVDIFLVNEIEGEEISGESEPQKILDKMVEMFPNSKIVLTLGKDGAYLAFKEERIYQPIVKIGEVLDTTAAGDTFAGYYIAGIYQGKSDKEALLSAATASGIAVTRMGASSSIPSKEEVEEKMPS